MSEPTPTDETREAAYWKERYEEERVRLAKLWVAYQEITRTVKAPVKGPQEPAAGVATERVQP